MALDSNHSTPWGMVCMWQQDESSRAWTTAEGLFARIEEWCDNEKNGWPGDQLREDAFLNFTNQLPGRIATFDLSELRIVNKRGWGEFHATVDQYTGRIDLKRGIRQDPSQLRGFWFHVEELNTRPPHEFSEIPSYLSSRQIEGFHKAISGRQSPEPLTPSGGADIVLFCWSRRWKTDLLVLACSGTGNITDGLALRPAPVDVRTLSLRAGPDAGMLKGHGAVLFGARSTWGIRGDVACTERGRTSRNRRLRHIAPRERGQAHCRLSARGDSEDSSCKDDRRQSRSGKQNRDPQSVCNYSHSRSGNG